MDSVELDFTPEALERAVDQALRLQTGARGLRAILESTLLDVMYEVPSRSDVRRVSIDAEAISHLGRPKLFAEDGRPLSWAEEAMEAAA
jgi:ATP-dependent Clp protease ATP-binding subunit ClpX